MRAEKSEFMERDVISTKIFQMIISNPKVKSMNSQSVRNAISKIHKDKDNYGITMNAAAYEFARRKGFSVYKSLGHEDKKSLQHLTYSGRTATRTAEPSARKVKVVNAKPDFQSPFVQEANDNTTIYPYIYILENSLRSIIFKKFGTGQDWWKDKRVVIEDVQNYAIKIQEAEKKYPWIKDRGNHPIYYVGLFELFKIIEKNWKSKFKDVFSDLELLRAWIKESVPIRNIVAHNVKTRPQERQNIKIKTDYICRLIERWNNTNAANK